MTPPWHIAILIPARDEQDLLPRCLRSIREARLRLPPQITSDLIIVSDSSTDETYRIARSIIASEGLVFESSAGCVGSARALAAESALQRYAGPPDRCWFANTDADCEVPSTWLLDHLAVADSGAAALAGVVDVDSFAEHEPGVSERFRLSYLIRPDGTHPHVHGANFGVRADAYLLAGGWSDLTTAEDHDLWNRLRRDGLRTVANASVRVLTSGRRIGRAPLGFAGALSAHDGALA